ncbi:MAG: LON peptidase substrate-binding domain-containing protein, partial [Anaerolineales bacterium]
MSETSIDIPAILLKEVVILPHMAVPLELDEGQAQAARAAAATDGRILLLFARPDSKDEEAHERFYPVGVIAEVQTVQRPGGSVLIAQGLMRAEMHELV